MASPKNSVVPRRAPEGSLSLAAALDIFGRATDPAWTGEEIESDRRPEPSDEEFAYLALLRVTQEASEDRQVGPAPLKPTEAQILAELHSKRDRDFAERRRWVAAAEKMLDDLHRKMLPVKAISLADGQVRNVPSDIWAADGAVRLFDNGGHVEVRGGTLTLADNLGASENLALILVNREDLEELVLSHPQEGTPIPVRSSKIQFPGRPVKLRRAIENEYRRRIERNELRPTLKEDAEDLHRWALEKFPEDDLPTPATIGNNIRMLRSQAKAKLPSVT